MERPQLVLPFAEREYIDVPRLCRILGVTWPVVERLEKLGEIDLVDYRKRGWKRVRYQSVVDYCDRLRIRYAITDRRPPLSNSIFRHRDEDLLPFPLRDTICVRDACDGLGFRTAGSVIRFIESGVFEAYKLIQDGPSPWRISLISFMRFCERTQHIPARDSVAK